MLASKSPEPSVRNWDWSMSGAWMKPLKAGLNADAYKERGCRFWIFQGQIFNEREFREKEAREAK